MTDKSVFRRDTGTLEIVLFYEERSLSVQTQNDRDTQERSNNGKKYGYIIPLTDTDSYIR